MAHAVPSWLSSILSQTRCVMCDTAQNHPRFAVGIEDGWVGGIKLTEFESELEAWKTCALCNVNWVLFRVEWSGMRKTFTEISAGGIGLAKPTIRKHVVDLMADPVIRPRTSPAISRRMFGAPSAAPAAEPPSAAATERAASQLALGQSLASRLSFSRPPPKKPHRKPSDGLASIISGGAPPEHTPSAAPSKTAEETAGDEASRAEQLLALLAHLQPPPNRWDALRYLKWAGGDVSKAAVQFEATWKWRQSEGVEQIYPRHTEGGVRRDLTLADPVAEHALDLATGDGACKLLDIPDFEGRPIFYYDLRHLDLVKLIEAGVSQRDIMQRYVRWMERIVEQVDASAMPMNGHLAVYDVTHLSPFIFLRSLNMWTEIAKISNQHYPELLGTCLIMGTPASASWVFDRVVPLLVDELTLPKVLLISGDPADTLVERGFLTREQVDEFTPYGAGARRSLSDDK